MTATRRTRNSDSGVSMELLASQVRFDAKPSANSHQIVSPNSKRYAIVFFPPSAGTAWISNDPMTAQDQGLPLVAGQAPLVLCITDLGECIQRPWFVVNDAGLHPVSWIDAGGL